MKDVSQGPMTLAPHLTKKLNCPGFKPFPIYVKVCATGPKSLSHPPNKVKSFQSSNPSTPLSCKVQTRCKFNGGGFKPSQTSVMQSPHKM